MRNIRYILIDEICFIDPRLLIKIDYLLCDVFPENKYIPFGGISNIIVDDLRQLPLVTNNPMYAPKTIGKVLWENFNNVVTLETIFW